MSAPGTDNSPSAAPDSKPNRKDLKSLERVRGIIVSFQKFINAKTIYAENNPTVTKFAEACYQSFRTYFEKEKELLLTIEQYRIRWNDEIVYENCDKAESLAFLLYKDGVGELIFQSSVKPGELNRLADIIKNELYSPSSHLDMVGKLWQAEFGSIYYRVFDEFTDGTEGDGSGSGTESRDKPLQADDHRDLPPGGEATREAAGKRLVPLGIYLNDLIERSYPGATADEREGHFQDVLHSLFTINVEEFNPWHETFNTLNNRDKLLWFLDVMLDFAQTHYTPSTVRDITDIIERLVRYIIDEANISTLIALLRMQKKMARTRAFSTEFERIPQRIEHELTNTPFLLALGRVTNRSRDAVKEVLQYFHCVGASAVPGVCELLATIKDTALHQEACDTLLEIAPDGIMQIIDSLNLDNPYEARDAVYLLYHVPSEGIPPVIRKLLASPDIQVRQDVIDYLAHNGSEDAARLLVSLLDDEAVVIRTKTLAAVESFPNPLVVDKVISMCSPERMEGRQPDELERLFRTFGKLAGERGLPQIKRLAGGKRWVPFGKNKIRQNKMLAITALRYIPGRRSRELLEELAGSHDNLVKSKAQHALKQSGDPGETGDHQSAEKQYETMK